MGLTGKEPVDKPCEADSFEEAAWKNRLRLNSERNECLSLCEEMKENGEEIPSTLDPAFWTGAVSANEAAFKIYQEEQAACLSRVSARLAGMKDRPNIPETQKTGWREILVNWQLAIGKNNPSLIVYW
jgi:hypothetical protein